MDIFLNDTGWIADNDNIICSKGFCHHKSNTNNRSIRNNCALKEGNILTDPYMVADNDVLSSVNYDIIRCKNGVTIASS